MTSFMCPKCGRVSHHPEDAREGYCGHCHEWTGELAGLTVDRRAGRVRLVVEQDITDRQAFLDLCGRLAGEDR